MADVYDQQLKYAKSLGFKTPAEAIMKYGAREFKKMFNDYPKQKLIEETVEKVKYKKAKGVAPMPPKEKKVLVNKSSIWVRKKSEAQKKQIEFDLMNQGGKKLYLNENYIIFPDGRTYSLIYNKFMTPQKIKDRHGRFYYSYSLQDRKRYVISRLVYLHFGNHGKRDYNLIDLVIYKDGDTSNYHIDNLEECCQSYLNGKSRITPTGINPDFVNEKQEKIKSDQKENIEKMLKEGYSREVIAKEHNTSPSSVTRFLKRHNLNNNGMMTAMQDLKEDLEESIESGKEALNDINDEHVRQLVKIFFELTLKNVIKRIDEELLETEKKQIVLAWIDGKENDEFGNTVFEDAENYFNKKHKSC